MTTPPQHLFGSIEPTADNRATVRFERRFDASPAEVWAALTEPDQIAAWLCPTQVDLRVGGRIEHTMGDTADEQVSGQILALEPQKLLEYEWHYPGEDRSVLRYELSAEGEATVLRLTHSLLQADQAAGYGPGWHAYLDRLEASVAGTAVPSWEDRFRDLRPLYG